MLPKDRNDREYKKFIERDDGQTAVAVDVEISDKSAGGSLSSEYSSAGDFSATYTSSSTITLSSVPFTITDSSQLVYVKVVANDNTSTLYTAGGANSFGYSSGVITIYENGVAITTLDSGDVYEVGVNGQKKAFDPSTNSNMESTLNPEYAHYTDPELLVTASDIVATTTVYKDQGAEIDMTGYNTLGVFVKFTVNDSATNTIKLLAKHTSAGTEEFVQETAGDYIKTLGDASINIYYEFSTNHNIPIFQIQSTATTVGDTEGTLEIYITKGNK